MLGTKLPQPSADRLISVNAASPPGRPVVVTGAIALAVGLTAFATAIVGIELTRGTGGVSAIWPPDAIMLAAALLLPRRATPLLIGAGSLGIFVANLVSQLEWLSLGLPLCNAAGVALAAAGYRRCAALDMEGRFLGFTGARDLLAFVAICGGLGPIVSASLAAGLIGIVHGAQLAQVWTEWFLSDALGILVIAPVLLSAGLGGGKRLVAGRGLGEVALLLGLSVLVALAALGQDKLPLLFVLFPAVILPAFRLGFAGTGLVCAIVSTIAIGGTLLGHGPLMAIDRMDASERILLLQLFLLLLNLTALPVASAMDARRLAERRLLQISNLQQAILDGTDYAMIATDTDGIITQFNAGAARLLGYEAEEVIGSMTPTIFHLDSEMTDRATALSAELQRPVMAGVDVFVAKSHLGPDERDWTYVRKDGTQLPVRLSVTALKDATGAVTGYLGIAKDVTQQRKTEERLRESRRDLQSVIDSIPAMIAYWDRDLKNRFCNKAYIEWFGKSPNQIMTGMHIREVIGERLFALNRPYMEGALRGVRQSFEREIVIPSGERRQTQAHYIPNIIDGQVVGFYVLVFDISALKRSEAALRAAKEVAENATRAKSDFLARMSHELRTPMNSIIGFTEFLQTRHPGPLTDRQTEYLGLVHFSAKHLLHLIDDILELTRIEAGKLKVVSEPVSVAPLLRSVVSSLTPLAEKHGVEIRKARLDPDLPAVAADPTRAAEVLLNFGSNAIKYNHRGGHVEFSAERMADGQIRLKVSDDGIGIPLEHQAGLFQEFNRLGQEQTGIEGTGIGLTLSKRLVELMHGTIGFVSIAGSGSTFWVDLPIEPKAT